MKIQNHISHHHKIRLWFKNVYIVFLYPSIYNTVLTKTKEAQQFLCYSTDTVTGCHSNMFRRKLHCVYMNIYIYKFQNRTSPQFYSKHSFTDSTFCFYTNTIARSRSHTVTLCLNIYTRIKCSLSYKPHFALHLSFRSNCSRQTPTEVCLKMCVCMYVCVYMCVCVFVCAAVAFKWFIFM